MVRAQWIRVFSLVLLAAAGGCARLSAARHTDEEIRFSCLRKAHATVKVPESDSSNRETMVKELYLRCLDVYGVDDAPASAGASTAP